MKRIFGNETAFLDKCVFENIELINTCVSQVKNELIDRPEIVVFGKKCKQQRRVGFFSNESCGYNYSTQKMPSKSLTNELMELLVIINRMFGGGFNGILVNEYGDGNDYIGAHSDDVRTLDHTGVVSISYGAERTFRIRDKKTKFVICDETTTHCGVLHMGGKFQELYTHEIPKQTKIKESRISFTFRKHNM
jgi:alkylated DNA repair dioxygenase AlkB